MPSLDGNLRRGVRSALAQVDAFLLHEYLLAPPRPQVFGQRAAKTPPQVGLMVMPFCALRRRRSTVPLLHNRGYILHGLASRRSSGGVSERVS